MAISYEHIMSLKSEGVEATYGDRETMLYTAQQTVLVARALGLDSIDTDRKSVV